PVEPKLKSINPEFVIKLEESMGLVRLAMDQDKGYPQVLGTIQSADQNINTADTLIEQAPASPWLTFTVAAAILLREGFEAVLIIIALLGVLRAAGSAEAARWVHGGWIAALFLGFITWIFSGWMMDMSGASRELMEGVTSLIAVVILLYMGFWLHS